MRIFLESVSKINVKTFFRDLKPWNVMIDRLGNCRLGDFGYSRQMPPGGLRGECGTAGYMCPEASLN